MYKPTQQEIDWFNELAAFRLDNIYFALSPAQDGALVDRRFLQCYAVAQSVAMSAGGFLDYHEGKAYDKITGKRQRHAWNTFHGEIIDLMWPPSMYRDYQSEKGYTCPVVKDAVSKRNGTFDWLENPETPL